MGRLLLPKILLISPRGTESFWEMRWFTDHLLSGKKHVSPPIGLATIAALTPNDWEVEICDEYIEEIPWDTAADIVGVTGTCLQYPRQIEILRKFRRLGKYTVAGGPYVSLVPERYSGEADALVLGEAEYTWPQFCQDWPSPATFYKDFRTPDLADSPIPRFDLLKLDQYLYATAQFSRGCPFACEFCDAIVIYGRKPRTKGIDQMIAELEAAYAAGARNLFFAEDNLIGHQGAARKLFRALAEWQETLPEKMKFGTELSINAAYDDEMLYLMRKANFDWVFVGIETPNLETLKNIGKPQNTKQDLIQSIYKMYRAGIHVYGGFVLGFDEDDPSVFDRMYKFIMRTGIQVAQISVLVAFPKTPLFERLKSDGRLAHEDASPDLFKGYTNIIPLKMTREQLALGHRLLYKKLYTHEAIAERINVKVKEMGNAGMVYNDYGNFATARRLIKAIPTDIRRTPKKLRPMVLKEWSLGLMIKDFVERTANGRDSSREVHL